MVAVAIGVVSWLALLLLDFNVWYNIRQAQKTFYIFKSSSHQDRKIHS